MSGGGTTKHATTVPCYRKWDCRSHTAWNFSLLKKTTTVHKQVAQVYSMRSGFHSSDRRAGRACVDRAAWKRDSTPLRFVDAAGRACDAIGRRGSARLNSTSNRRRRGSGVRCYRAKWKCETQLHFGTSPPRVGMRCYRATGKCETQCLHRDSHRTGKYVD